MPEINDITEDSPAITPEQTQLLADLFDKGESISSDGDYRRLGEIFDEDE